MIFFTSDTHWSHTNILEFCNRPFSDVREMNEKLIENWNATVSKDDEIYHLGDFSFDGPSETFKIIKRLNGKKTFLIGNHDRSLIKIQDQLPECRFLYGIHSLEFHVYMGETLRTQQIDICHYPLLEWPGYYKKAIHLHGHQHNKSNLKEEMKLGYSPRRYDVGVDANHYFPISLHDIIKTIDGRVN